MTIINIKLVKNNTKIAIFSLFVLFWATNVKAFTQTYTPTDPNLVYQKYLDMINIGPSWSSELKLNKEVVVAVLDSGVDLDHPDLVNNIWVNAGEIAGDGVDNDKNSYIDDVHGWDFIYSDGDPQPDIDGEYDFTAVNHGTVVAGVIAATINQNGIVGIAPQAKIMPIKILDTDGTGNVMVLTQAIDYAVENGADVINLSLVGDTYNDNLKEAIINAYNKGVMIVAASGNEENIGLSLDIDPRYPICELDNVNRVLGVAAVDSHKVLADFSNHGEACIDISAPGTEFYSTVFQDNSNEVFKKYYLGGWNGTSVAAPVVAATAALIKGAFPELRPYDIYNIIISNATDISVQNPIHSVDLGAGLINVGQALNAAQDYYNNSLNIVLAPQKGLKPEILLLDTEAKLLEVFLAYNVGFTGGVNVAVGDVDGNGQDEIVTAPMAGGGPHIRVFDKDGNVLSEFFAYDASFDGGVNVALGDVNNDGLEEIVLSPMGKHVSEIKVFNYQNSQKASWLAYDSKMTAGVNISVADVNLDGWPEIVTVPAKNYAPTVKAFSMNGRLKSEFLAFSNALTTGVKILAKDISGDGLPEILVWPTKGAAALLRVYDHNGLEKDNFYLRDAQDRNGYNLELIK
ncbi:MAG: hypothetical protein A2611_01995 [Candidatus Komeilibacteria bacterium RIFOXYD1_FULL_37_29]|nr:MAG: hypothetical protein A2611_01995 [Candidatus Komeilibacteria bacterium RIFOXYD1_FULL_37_29]